jgi:hypothetical protein
MMNSDTERDSRNSRAEPEQQFHEWKLSYSRWLERDNVDKTEAAACQSVAVISARFTLSWCLKNQRGQEAHARMWEVAKLVHELHGVLTHTTLKPEPKKRPKLTPTHLLWQHVQFTQFISAASVEELEFPIDDVARLKGIATEYLADPSLQNPYLDWVIIDTLIFTELTLYFHEVMKARYGLAYAVTGKRWKAILFRLFSVPATFAFGWIAPGALCWWLYPEFPAGAAIAAAAYYLLSIYLLGRYLIRLALYRVRTGKTPRRETFERLAAMGAAYFEMREDTIHVPSLKKAIQHAKDLGAEWGPHVLSILDNVTARNSTTWMRRPAYYEAD